MTKIAPSVLTANFNNLKEEITSISKADLIHLDIMDGHFVPNISFGPHICKAISNLTDVAFDIHLMTSNPLDWIEKFRFEQTRYITVHVESNRFLEAIEKIRALGMKPGLTLKPQTPIEALKPYLNLVDLILVMSVEPGFGGQSFIMESLEKIKILDQWKKALNLGYSIEVDGGVNKETAALCKAAGADILVVGSYLFNQENRNKVIGDLQK